VLSRPQLLAFSPPLPQEKQAALSSLHMQPAIKLFLKFSAPFWPPHLQGIIMACEGFLVPEVWFKQTSSSTAAGGDGGEEAVCFCTGFITSRYALRVLSLPEEEVYRRFLSQLDRVFSSLTDRHCYPSLPPPSPLSLPLPLPPPSSLYLGGMMEQWQPETHPFIGGGYCSPATGAALDYGEVLARPCGKSSNIFFAGEAVNGPRPAATAHRSISLSLYL
jgi:hypothetical protein